jgi:hypothetical protein
MESPENRRKADDSYRTRMASVEAISPLPSPPRLEASWTHFQYLSLS